MWYFQEIKKDTKTFNIASFLTGTLPVFILIALESECIVPIAVSKI